MPKPSATDPKIARSRANRIGAGILLAGLIALYFLPDLTRKTHYVFPKDEAATQTQRPFPTDRPLPFYSPSSKGENRSLKDLFGEHPTLIVNLWATWCPPCVDELPSLEYLHRALSTQDAKTVPGLITLSVDEQYAEVKELFVTLKMSPTFGILHDGKAEIAQSVGTFRFPETYWIDREGRILHKWVGPQDWMGETVLSRLRQGIGS